MAPTATTALHIRDNSSVTATLERRLLIWIAEQLPRSVNSDHLSAVGLGAMGCAGLAFAAFRFTPWAAAAVAVSLAANWFGDSLDGTVARVRQQQRPRYGFYVDHIIDLAGTTMLVGGLAWSGLMTPLVALTVLVGFLLVSSETYLATHTAGVFRMSFLGFGPTELRLLLIVGALRAAHSPFVEPFGVGPFRLFDVGGVVAAIALGLTFVTSSVRNTRALYLAEPMPAPTAKRRAA